MSNNPQKQHTRPGTLDATTSAWTITHEHANAVLHAAVPTRLCTCGASDPAASHHALACPYRLVRESAQMLSLLASSDISHYKGQASLAEMVSTRAGVSRTHRPGGACGW